MKWAIILLTLIACIKTPLCADVHTVDISGASDFTSIQAAINAASFGDEIAVGPGVYYEKIIVDKPITIKSTGGASSTIIDASLSISYGSGTQYNSVITFNSSQEGYSAVEGFTIQGGRGYGGIGGGGSNSYGGGIAVLKGSPVIRGNIITNNNVDLANEGHGGGIYSGSGTSPLIENNFIMNNSTYSHDDNGGGAGLYVNWASPILFNNIIANNTGSGSGGGIHLNSASAVLINNTIADNSISFNGGGIYCRGSSEVTTSLENSIIWGNTAPTGDQIFVGGYWGISELSLNYSDIEGGYAGEENISENPLFEIGPLGDYYLSQIDAGQLLNSPCFDAGSDLVTAYSLEMWTTRTDGIGDSDLVDMGYHYIPEPTTVLLLGMGGLLIRNRK